MKIQKILLTCCFVLALTACSKEPPAKNTETENVKTESAERLANPKNLISLEKAKEQLENYNQAHPEELGDEYALRTWISIEDLKAYIQYIEVSSAEKEIEVTGIDFIHAQYKSAAPGSANPENKTYDKTLMLAPTYGSGSANIAFDPIYSEKGKPKDLKVLLSELLSNTGPEEKGEGGKKSSVANLLTTCPNICD